MDVRPIRTEADYDWALAEIARYFESQPEIGSPEGDRFDVLSDLIAAYEDRRFPMPDLDPIEVLEVCMAEMGRTQSDLATLFGSRSRASEVLSRKRALTVDMIHKLDRDWGVPPGLMVKPYRRVA